MKNAPRPSSSLKPQPQLLKMVESGTAEQGEGDGHEPDLPAIAEAHDPETLCFISPRRFRILWWLIIVIYSLVGLQLVLLGGFYFFIMGIPSVAYYMAIFHLIPVSQFPLVVAVYALMATLIASEIIRILRISLRSRRLTLIDEAALNAATARAAAVSAAIRTSTTPIALLRRLWFGYMRFVSVRGPHFEFVMLVRELIEISVQVSQAYQSSRFTPNVYLNFAFGVLIVVNCISSPLLERWNHNSIGRFRMNVLIVDLLLDFVWLLLPLSLFPHYIQGFFGGEAVMYEDTFMVRAFMETQLMFATSKLDLFTKVLPSLSIYFTIRKIRVLVRRQEDPTHTNPATAKVVATPLRAPRSSSSYAVATATGRTLRRSIRIGSHTQPHHYSYLPRYWRHMHIAQLIIESVLLALGAFTLIMYVLVVAFSGSCESGCKLILHPWLEYSSCHCSVQEISCHVRGITGTSEQLRHAFDTMDQVGIQSLILSHCPDLEIPEEIRTFNNLYGLEIYNSTISSWPPAASLSADYFTRLSFVYLIRTHLSELPIGLLQDDLPSSLQEINVIVSNLTTLPDDLHVKWPGIRTMYLDHGQLAVLPAVLGKMRLEALSLYDNNIRVIPNTTFVTSSLNYLILNGNPLEQLPTSLGDISALYELQLQETKLSQLTSEWLNDQPVPSDLKVYARGSPMCSGHDAPNDAQPVDAPLASATMFEVISGGVIVSCAVRGSFYNGQRSLAYFALEGKTLERNIV